MTWTGRRPTSGIDRPAGKLGRGVVMMRIPRPARLEDPDVAGETRPSFSRPVAGPQPLSEPAGSRKGPEGPASGCRKPLIALILGKAGREGSPFFRFGTKGKRIRRGRICRKTSLPSRPGHSGHIGSDPSGRGVPPVMPERYVRHDGDRKPSSPFVSLVGVRLP